MLKLYMENNNEASLTWQRKIIY